MIIDVRNILFFKKTSYKSYNFNDILKNKNFCVENFVTFGFYDSLYIYKLEQNSSNPSGAENEHILIQIEKENNHIFKQITENILIHPLYAFITEDMNIEQESIEDFWKKQRVFLCCTSVYMKSNVENHNLLLDELKNKLKVSDYIVYKSLGYADYMIFWKTNDLKQDSHNINDLNSVSEISCFNTIVNVNSCYFEPLPLNLEVDKLAINIMGVQYKNNDNILDIIEGTVGTAKSKYSSCSTNCNIDFTLIYQNLSVESIVNFAQFINNNMQKINISPFLYINTDIMNNNASLSSECELDLNCTEIEKKYLALKAQYDEILKYTERYDSTVRALGQLLNLMISMSDNRMYLSVCRLLYKSVKYSIITFKHLQDKGILNDEDVINAQTYFIQLLLRGCWSFLDSIINQDLNYVKEPKYRPLITNVNVNILEYYNGLFYLITDFLSKIDAEICPGGTNANDEVSCLIVPKLCRRVKTQVHKNSELRNLLFIDLPVNMVSNCLMSVESIAHEASHKWGDFCRLRSERAKYFLSCISAGITYNLLYTSNVYVKIRDRLFSENIYTLQQIESNLSCFDELKKNVLCHVMDLLIDDNFITELLATSLANLDECEFTNYTDINALCIEYSDLFIKNRNTLLSGKKEVSKYDDKYYRAIFSVNIIIEDLYTFFTECYADIFMIKLFDINFEQYLEMFNYEMPDKNILDDKCYMMLQRIAIVYISLYGEDVAEIDKLENNILYNEIKNLIKYMLQRSKIIHETNDARREDLNSVLKKIQIDSKRYYDYIIVEFVVIYLQDCCKAMDNAYKDDRFKSQLDEIRTSFNGIVDKTLIFNDKFYQKLNLYFNKFIE